MKSVGTVRTRRTGGVHLTHSCRSRHCSRLSGSPAARTRIRGLGAAAHGARDADRGRSHRGSPGRGHRALNAALAQAAADHQVMLVDDAQAPRFRLKGYVTASAAQDGKTALAYVWDVFDASNRRAQRVTGTQEVAGDPADPWSRLDGKALQRIAGKSMDGIADFLASAAALRLPRWRRSSRRAPSPQARRPAPPSERA